VLAPTAAIIGVIWSPRLPRMDIDEAILLMTASRMMVQFLQRTQEMIGWREELDQAGRICVRPKACQVGFRRTPETPGSLAVVREDPVEIDSIRQSYENGSLS